MITPLYGVRPLTKRLGYVADYCETCRRITQFKIEEIRMAPHIYFVRVGPGTLVGHIQTCYLCRMETDSYVKRFKAISKKRIAPIEQLASVTFPTVYEVFQAGLQRAERIRTGSETFDPAEREKALAEIFVVASNYYQQHERRDGMRVLINGLHPLAPTEQELRECLSRYRDGKHSIGALRSADLFVMIQRKETSTDCY